MSTIVIAGASGFMGRFLAREFRGRGDTVIEIGRRGTLTWGRTAAITDALEGADLLVNLAGRSVNCRYGPENRAEIFSSRLDTTRELAEALRACENPPILWINASTATVYRHAEDRPMTEAGGELGEGFSVEVARAWETAFFEGELPGIRRVALRTAIVLGAGGALIPMLRLARFGLGGPQFDGRWPATRARREAGTYHAFRARWGRQRFSWVHLRDVLGVIDFVRARPELDDVFNVAAPGTSDNRTLMRLIRKALGIPVGLPAFRWMTELGAMVIRTETELILKSRWVVPERLLDAGYVFEHPELEGALTDIVAELRRSG